MTIIEVKPTLLLTYDDGTTETVELNMIPRAGCEATQRWIGTQLKPDPDHPGQAISKYADSATSGPDVLIKNLGNEILLGKVAEFCAICPSPEIVAAQQQVVAAQQALDTLRKTEAGLL